MSLRAIQTHPAWAPRGRVLPRGPVRLAERLAMIAAVIGAIAWLASVTTAEHRALAQLPAEERLALYHRTLEDLASVCANPPPGLRTHCERQAAFALAFPECDDVCRARSVRVVPHTSAR